MYNEITEQFDRTGYTHFKKVIPETDVKTVRNIGLSMKNTILEDNLLEKPKSFGAPVYSRSIDMSSRLDDTLVSLYTSPWLVKIAKLLLGQETIYLFNDQIVIKLPNEDFLFPEHTDNWFGPDPAGALAGTFKSITCCWVLDDMTEFNGPVSILNKETNEWITPMAEAGDMLVWNGNTPHKSGINMSGSPRCVWLQIYSTSNIAEMKNVNASPYIAPIDFTRFHSIKL